MAERRMLTKKTRFEVFKRDKFTCQYCGRMSPDVILEVDHIKPVSKGGSNKMMNLITSCRDCNRGKRDNVLSDDAEIKKQQAQLLDLADRREQLKMIVEWRRELLESQKEQIDLIDDLIKSITGMVLNESGKQTMAKYLNRFSYDEIWEATKISFDKYFDGSWTESVANRTFNTALQKIGGICYNRQNSKRGEQDGNL